MSDPSRLAILQHLALGEHRVRDLTAHLGLAQSTVSAHLACLRECGLVSSRPEGRASVLQVPHVIGVHDLHASTIAAGLPVLTAHVVVEEACFTQGHVSPGTARPPDLRRRALRRQRRALHLPDRDPLPQRTGTQLSPLRPGSARGRV
ncbi:ArsR/SmtB family transcription factor [Tessaracoccus defluvii]|uniref:ArsR/SmtB family transcription factor n=1 Tax=Tessaracoccus defluvii TaxID=1285901 RepID=UPI003CD05CA7